MTYPESFERQLGPGGLELRSLPADVAQTEARAADGAVHPVIAGYGSVFDVVSRIGGEYGWDEVWDSGAFSASIVDADVRSMFNHETDRLLGRTKSGTLRLSTDATGLAYEVDVNPDDPLAMSVHAQVDRGDVDGSSVWFRTISAEWTYPDDTNALLVPLRRITEAALIEVGPVTFPAFEATTAAVRSLDPLDTALRSAGVSGSRRARLAVDLLTGSDAVEDELRTLFARTPELRDAVCACDTRSGPAAVPAAPPKVPAVTAPEPAAKSNGLAVARARLDMLRPTSA